MSNVLHRSRCFAGLQSQYEKGSLRLFILTILALLLLHYHFRQTIYTGWDTHDLGFVNFLYFSDSLKNSSLPLWNHYIFSGDFFANFNNIGLFSPFQLPFVLLSWFINPVHAYELMIQFVVILGGIGSYLLFSTFVVDRQISLFGALVFSAAILIPIVGQFAFVVSLCSFPWLIYTCIKISEFGHASRHPERSEGSPWLSPCTLPWYARRSLASLGMTQGVNEILRCIFLGTIWALFISSGYLWMNLVNIIIACLFSFGVCFSKDKLKPLLIFFGTVGVFYACLVLPTWLAMHFNYQFFHGDFITPEPRLRGLSAIPSYSYSNIYQALIVAIDPRMIMNYPLLFKNITAWSLGVGFLPWMVLLVAPFKKPIAHQVFWLIFLFAMLLYSAGNNNVVGLIVRHIPLINANRWWFVGTFYVLVFLIFSIVPRVSLFKTKVLDKKRYTLKVAIVGSGFLVVLVYLQSPSIEFELLIGSIILVWMLGVVKQMRYWTNVLSAVILFTIMSLALMPSSGFLVSPLLDASGENGYFKQVFHREKNTTITTNHRHLGEGHDYVFNDEQWLLKKIPFSHGYNNLSNPLYWYVKNESFLKQLVFITQDIRKEKNIVRDAYPSDNTYAEALMGDVMSDSGRTTIPIRQYQSILLKKDFTGKLQVLHIEANTASMRVVTNAPALLVFNNVDFPGWNVYVNGKQQPMVRTNRIFQGVFLDGAGCYDVVFKFRPMLTMFLLLLPYLVLLGCLIFYVFQRYHKRRIR